MPGHQQYLELPVAEVNDLALMATNFVLALAVISAVVVAAATCIFLVNVESKNLTLE